MRGNLKKIFFFAALIAMFVPLCLHAAGTFDCWLAYPSTLWQYDQDSTYYIEVWVNTADSIQAGSLGFVLNTRSVRIDSVKIGSSLDGDYDNQIAKNDSFFVSLGETISYGLIGTVGLGHAIMPKNTDVLWGTLYFTFKKDSLNYIKEDVRDFFIDSMLIPPAAYFVLTDFPDGNSVTPGTFTNDTISLKYSRVVDINPGVIPVEFELSQNFPNPFNPDTKIQFAIPQTGHVNLAVYNVMGQKVRTLVNEVLDAGYKEVVWNGLDDSGNTVASGVYLYKIQTGNFSDSKKMSLVK